MIIGVGIDIICHKTMADALEDDGERAFERFTFTEAERLEATRSNDSVEYYSGRFAVKEAVTKALSETVDRGLMSDIETTSLATGAPKTRLLGALANALPRVNIKTSISHEGDLTIAMAVVEGDPTSNLEA